MLEVFKKPVLYLTVEVLGNLILYSSYSYYCLWTFSVLKECAPIGSLSSCVELVTSLRGLGECDQYCACSPEAQWETVRTLRPFGVSTECPVGTGKGLKSSIPKILKFSRNNQKFKLHLPLPIWEGQDMRSTSICLCLNLKSSNPDCAELLK